VITIEEFFDDGGPLASVLPAYSKRAEQVRLAKAVASVLEAGGALLGDGPIGTGKSMGYLAPVALGMRLGSEADETSPAQRLLEQ
jgi:ATP-dependent DNA helicase DinG